MCHIKGMIDALEIIKDNTVYIIDINGHSQCYIGETKRASKSRDKGHIANCNMPLGFCTDL